MPIVTHSPKDSSGKPKAILKYLCHIYIFDEKRIMHTRREIGVVHLAAIVPFVFSVDAESVKFEFIKNTNYFFKIKKRSFTISIQ